MTIRYAALVAAGLTVVFSSPAFATRIYVPIVPGSPPSPSAPSSSPSSPGGSGGVPAGVVIGAGCFVAHLADFVRVGTTQRRKRTDKEVEFILATACSAGLGLPIYLARWGDGKRVARPMIDVIDPKHNAGAARYEPVPCPKKKQIKKKKSKRV